MNRRRAPLWLLAASLALNLGFVTAVVIQQLRPAPERHAVPPLNLPDHLGLTAEQRARWQQLEPPFLAELDANWRAIRTHREALVRQILAAQPDPAAIRAEQARIAALQDAQQQRVIAQLLAERALLDDAQRTRLMALLLGRYAQEATAEERLHRN